MSRPYVTKLLPGLPRAFRGTLFSKIRSIVERDHRTKKMHKDELLRIIHSVGEKLEVKYTKIMLEFCLKESRRFEGMMIYMQVALSPEEQYELKNFADWTRISSKTDRSRMLVQWGINHIDECAGAKVISNRCNEFLSTYIAEDDIEFITESDMSPNKVRNASMGDEEIGGPNKSSNRNEEEAGNSDEEVTNNIKRRICKEKNEKTIVLEKTNTNIATTMESDLAKVADDGCCGDGGDVCESDHLISKKGEAVYREQGTTLAYWWPFRFRALHHSVDSQSQ
jgi:hypothetical protein